MKLFLDESGTSEKLSALLLLEVPEFAEEYLNQTMTPKKELPDFLQPVFESTNGEYKFSAFMNQYRKTGDKRLVDYLKERIQRLCALDISIYYSAYENAGFETTVAESEYLVNRFAINRYGELAGRSLSIVADKQFFPKDRCLEIFRAHEMIVARIKHCTRAKKTGVGYSKTPIRIGNSSSVKGLQAADLFAGALFQRYYRGNNEFYDLFKNKIRGYRENLGVKKDKDATTTFIPRGRVSYAKENKNAFS